MLKIAHYHTIRTIPVVKGDVYCVKYAYCLYTCKTNEKSVFPEKRLLHLTDFLIQDVMFKCQINDLISQIITAHH